MTVQSTSARFRRAYVGGTFDLLHHGHKALLKRCHEIAHQVVVSVNTDEFAESYKRPPSESLEVRMAKLKPWCDLAVVNVGGADSKPAIEVVRPDVIVHGDDWTGEPFLYQLGVTNDWLEERGIAVHYFQYTPGISTTQLLKER